MNAKKRKQLRKTIRAMGIDPTEKKFEAKHPSKTVTIKGKPVRVTRTTDLLAVSCGRAMYREMKGSAR